MAHINSFIRIPALALRQRIRPLPRIDPLAADLLDLRVWPNDIDFNLHLNNARFLSYMDYGRMHLTARIGVLNAIVDHHWAPLVGSILVTYRRSLPLWAKFTLSTRMLCWDEKWLYMEQNFHSTQGLAATALIKGLFRARTGNIPSQQVVDLVAPGLPSPEIPFQIRSWNAITREQLQTHGARVPLS